MNKSILTAPKIELGFFYNGDITDELSEEIKKIITFSIKEPEDLISFENQAKSLFAEGVLNTLNYKYNPKRKTAFLFLKDKGKYRLSIINRLHSSDIEHVKARLKSITKRKSHNLSESRADKLDEKYHFTFDLVNIAKNYKKKMTFSLTVLDEHYSDLHFKIDFSLDNKKIKDEDLYDDFHEYYENHINKDPVLNYHGVINNKLIAILLERFKNQRITDLEIEPHIIASFKQKIFIATYSFYGILSFKCSKIKEKIQIKCLKGTDITKMINISYSNFQKNIKLDEIIIQETEDTPSVIFSKKKNTFKIKGTTVPEDSKGFYTPIIYWLEKYIENPNPKSVFEFELVYANTSSGKQIIQIMILLEKISKNATIKWYYEEFDIDILEMGLRFSKLINVHFELIDLDYKGQERLIIKNDNFYTYFSKKRNVFKISGSCTNFSKNNAFQQIFDWLLIYKDDYDPNPYSVFEFNFEKIIPKNAEYIAKLLELLKELSKKSKITINWYYFAKDKAILQAGKDFEKEFKIDFKFQEKVATPPPKELIIQATDYTPEIFLSKEKNVFEISGASELQTSYEFYKPIIEWFKLYSSNPNPETKIKFAFEYLDTASQNQIIHIMLAIDEISKKVIIEWSHFDIVMQEYGERFSKLIRKDFVFNKEM